MTKTFPDYGSDAGVPMLARSFESALSALRTFYTDVCRTQDEIDDLETRLKQKQAALREMVQGTMPSLMRGAGIGQFTTLDGISVELANKVEYSLSKDRREAGIKWLIKNGHGDAVKRWVGVGFGVGTEKKAAELAEKLSNDYSDVVVEEKVEPATLGAIIKKRIEQLKPLPRELFGVVVFETALFKKPRKKSKGGDDEDNF